MRQPQADALAPADLISELLCAPADLLFNGGVGTFVKAAGETSAEVGDKANDAVRVNGRELRCRVVGEGGNLGLTQRARIEYARHGGPGHDGGRVNTDAVDNVAGVNCSDHEVNVKILLGGLVAGGQMSTEQRNQLLVAMTGSVADQVLYGSYTQTQALSLEMAQAVSMIGVHARLIRQLEQVRSLDRELESLPSEDALAARRSERRGLVSPELATLMAHTKIRLFEELLESDLPEDPYLTHDLERYFPNPLQRYREQMRGHRLRREIIATVVANQLVDRSGITFPFRLSEETGAATPRLARAYAAAREVFEMRAFWGEVEALDNRVEAGTQLAMLMAGRRLIERATRWLVRAHPQAIDIEATSRRFAPAARVLAAALPDALRGQDREAFEGRLDELGEARVPDALARRVASLPALLSVFDIAEEAAGTGRPEPVVTIAYFGIGSELGLDWLRDRILELPRSDRWQALARAALRDDLYRLHRSLTRNVLAAAGLRAGGAEGLRGGGEEGLDGGGEAAIAAWRQSHETAVARALGVLADVRASRTYDMTTLPVVLRELRNLIGPEVEPDRPAARPPARPPAAP